MLLLGLFATGCPAPCGGEGQECCAEAVACQDGLACTLGPIYTCETPLFDEDYLDSYSVVRDCRRSMDHDGLFIRIYANDVAADVYNARTGALPDGSTFIKEEHTDSTCNEAGLVGWAVMRRVAGSRPESDDWQFQFVDTAERELSANVREGCVSCHLNDCLGSGPGFDGTCAMPP
jgi:hypothetical protein